MTQTQAKKNLSLLLDNLKNRVSKLQEVDKSIMTADQIEDLNRKISFCLQMLISK